MLALPLGFSAVPAWADGDPASDVLAAQPLFLPQDAGLPPREQVQLDQLLVAALRGGHPIRVALITSSADLGSVTALWRQPQTYARFLGQELAFAYRGPLLVVMPDGFGVYGVSRSSADGRAALAGLRIPQRGAALGDVVVTAIRRLAALFGQALPLPSAATSPSRGTSGDATPWIALAIGGVLVAAAWGLSVRARPLRARGRAV